MTIQLCEFEIDVLKMLNGDPQDSITGWGAGLAAATEALHGAGFVERTMSGGMMHYGISDMGREVLKIENEKTSAPPTPQEPVQVQGTADIPG